MKKLILLCSFSIAATGIALAQTNDLFAAARTNNVKLAESLIAAGSNIDQQDDKAYTPLILSTYDDNYDVAKLLLQHHADTEKRDLSGRTALMGAAYKGNDKEVQLLLNFGARADAKDPKGLTSMMYAVMFARFSVIKILRENRSSAPPTPPASGN